MVTVLPLAHEVISASADRRVEGMACGRLEMACGEHYFCSRLRADLILTSRVRRVRSI
jgi:hypothetical protein